MCVTTRVLAITSAGGKTQGFEFPLLVCFRIIRGLGARISTIVSCLNFKKNKKLLSDTNNRDSVYYRTVYHDASGHIAAFFTPTRGDQARHMVVFVCVVSLSGLRHVRHAELRVASACLGVLRTARFDRRAVRGGLGFSHLSEERQHRGRLSG